MVYDANYKPTFERRKTVAWTTAVFLCVKIFGLLKPQCYPNGLILKKVWLIKTLGTRTETNELFIFRTITRARIFSILLITNSVHVMR